MSWNPISNYLSELMNSITDQWVWFVDDQIDVLQGKSCHYYGRLQSLYVLDDEEAERRLAEWQQRQRENFRYKR